MSLTPRRELRALALPADIMRLPNLHGYLKFPGPYPVASIVLRPVGRPVLAPRFVPRKDREPAPGTGDNPGPRAAAGSPTMGPDALPWPNEPDTGWPERSPAEPVAGADTAPADGAKGAVREPAGLAAGPETRREKTAPPAVQPTPRETVRRATGPPRRPGRTTGPDVLSIGAIASAAQGASYYETDGYYAKDDPEHREASAWFGKGAEALGLSGPVDPDTFRAILEGKVPDGSGTELGKRGPDGEITHRPGRDLTFSAPKSVSIAALIGGDARIVDVHDRAVKATLAWVEKNAVETRVQDPETGRMVRTGDQKTVVATFRHDTSRNLDPQLHTHAVLANMVQGEDGKWRTMANEKLYESKMLLGALYRNELAAGLTRLGYGIEKTHADGRFEIAGVSREAIEAFSTRRAEIEAAMAERGLGAPADNPRHAERAALMTRATKREVDRGELRHIWQRQAADLGLDAGALAPEGGAGAAAVSPDRAGEPLADARAAPRLRSPAGREGLHRGVTGRRMHRRPGMPGQPATGMSPGMRRPRRRWPGRSTTSRSATPCSGAPRSSPRRCRSRPARSPSRPWSGRWQRGRRPARCTRCTCRVPGTRLPPTARWARSARRSP